MNKDRDLDAWTKVILGKPCKKCGRNFKDLSEEGYCTNCAICEEIRKKPYMAIISFEEDFFAFGPFATEKEGEEELKKCKKIMRDALSEYYEKSCHLDLSSEEKDNFYTEYYTIVNAGIMDRW